MRIAYEIGRSVYVDHATNMMNMGHYARCCVEVDITRTLLSKFRLYHRVRKVEYEGIHLVCFNCGIYGHQYEKCHELQTVNVKVAKNVGKGGVQEVMTVVVVEGGCDGVKQSD